MSTTNYRDQLDPELLAAYDASPGFDLSDVRGFYETTHAAELVALKDDPEVLAKDAVIEGPADNPELKVRIYRPAVMADEVLPVVMFFHGGGFVFGSVYRQNDFCNRYAKNVGCVVFSVEYRLAPDWTAPAPVEDAYAALVYLEKHAAELKIDPKRIAAMGLSAGGGICAALALMTRDRKGPQLVLQMPLYAELDHTLSSPSASEYDDPHAWSASCSRISWSTYLDKNKPVDIYTAPYTCEDLTGLAPLFSYVGTLDPLRDENIEYWRRMLAAGVPVEAHVFPGAYHTFEVVAPNASASQFAYELGYRALKKAFAIW